METTLDLVQVKVLSTPTETGKVVRLILTDDSASQVGTKVLNLSPKQANQLAESIGIGATGVTAWQQLSLMCGVDESAVKCDTAEHKAGETYTNSEGVEVAYTEDGMSVLPQAIILPIETRKMLIQDTVKSITSRFIQRRRVAEEQPVE